MERTSNTCSKPFIVWNTKRSRKIFVIKKVVVKNDFKYLINLLNSFFIKSGQSIGPSHKIVYDTFFKFKCNLKKNNFCDIKNNNFEGLFEKALLSLCPTVGLVKHKYTGSNDNLPQKLYPRLLTQRQSLRFVRIFVICELREQNLKIHKLSNFLGKELSLCLVQQGSLYKRKKLYDKFIIKNNSLTSK